VDFVVRIALQFVFLSLVIYLLLNVVVIILYILGMFQTPVQEAPKPPLCTCGKWKYSLRNCVDCPGNSPAYQFAMSGARVDVCYWPIADIAADIA